MIKLGFLSVILAELSFEKVIHFASENNFASVEIPCWPTGKAERKYAGVTHIDVSNLTPDKEASIKNLLKQKQLKISALGYYPNPLDPDKTKSDFYVEHLKKVITAAEKLGIEVVNTFAGRDQNKNVEDNFKKFKDIWPPIIKFAEQKNVKVAIENCPMYFTNDEWPGGKNLAHCPAIWRQMFEEIPSRSFGLNYDPSHFIWQHMDYINPIYEFKDRLFHIHIKDAKIMQEKLDDVGILATPLKFHTPKIPGLGDVNWGRFFSALTDVGYKGPAVIEVEDASYEGSIETRKNAILQSQNFLKQFVTL